MLARTDRPQVFRQDFARAMATKPPTLPDGPRWDPLSRPASVYPQSLAGKIDDAPVSQGKVSEQSKHKEAKFRSQSSLITYHWKTHHIRYRELLTQLVRYREGARNRR